MKQGNKRKMRQIIAMILVLAMLTGLIPASLPETVHAATVSAIEQEKWYEITGKINSSWGGHITGEITLTNHSEEDIQDWQIEFPWDALITSMWGGNYEKTEHGYIITPMDYSRELAAGASVSIGFMAEGEDAVLEALTAEDFFQKPGVHITTAEERENMPPEPSKEPVPTIEATPESTLKPTLEPTATPTVEPTVIPTEEPTPEPTATPTIEPTPKPTATPTVEPTPTPTVEPTPTPTIEPTPTPTVEPTPTPTIQPTPTPTIEPTPTPTIEPTPEPTEEPLEDLYIYTDTTLTEDVSCRNLFLMGGSLTVNDCTVTVQGDYLQAEKSCTLQSGTMDIRGNAYVAAGTLTAKEQSVFQIAGTMDVSGNSLSFTKSELIVQGDLYCNTSASNRFSNSSLEIAGDVTAEKGDFMIESQSQAFIDGNLQATNTGRLYIYNTKEVNVKGNLIIASQSPLSLQYGSLILGGDLIQTEDAAENSLTVSDSFTLLFRSENPQQISLAYPETAVLGTMDFRESMKIAVPDEIHGKQLYGFEKITRKKELNLYLSNTTLVQDEKISCETVNWYGSTLGTNQYDLMVKGDLNLFLYRFSITGGSFEVQGDFCCSMSGDCSLSGNAEMDITGDVTVEKGNLMIDSQSRASIGGTLRATDTGRLFIYDTKEVKVKGDLIIDSQSLSDMRYGHLVLGGNLIQTEDAAENSLTISDSFTLLFRSKKQQQISLAHPSVTTLGTMDFRESVEMDVPDEIHGRQIYGFEKIGRKKELDLYLYNLSLEQDEKISCETVNWHGNSLVTNQYHLTIEGNLNLFIDYRLYVNGGKLEVQGDYCCKMNGDCTLSNNAEMEITGDVTVEKGNLMIDSQSRASIGGTLRLINTGRLYIYDAKTVKVKEDWIIDSQSPSILQYGRLTLGGNLLQTEDSAENSLTFTNDFNVVMNGNNIQTIDLPYVDEIPYLNLTDSAGVYLEQEFEGDRLDGVENILFEGDTLYTEFDEVHVGNDGEINGNYKCYGRLYIYEHKLKIQGDYHQYDTTNNSGTLEIMGDYIAHKFSLEMYGEKLHVHGNVKIKQEAIVNIYGGEDSVFLVEGDYISASRSHLDRNKSKGILELKGDLIQNESAYSIGMDITNMTVIFSGNKTQKVTVPNTFGELACIDMSNAVEVDFGGAMLHAGQIKGLSRIKSDYEISLWESRVVLEDNETVTGKLHLSDTYLDCNGYQLRVTGSFEQIDGMVKLNHGNLHIDGSYSIMGSGILQMIEADDLLRVNGSFSTHSTLSHATMLRDGRMELKRHFSQAGHEASFGSSDNFTIAFIGRPPQEVHFSNTVYSGFANIDPIHNKMVSTDDWSVAMEGYTFYIGRGIVSGLQEATGIEGLQDIALEIISSYGLSIAAGAITNPMVLAVIAVLFAVVAVISSSFMLAQSIEGIYSTATDDTSTSYQKMEDYAHDAILLIASVAAVVGSAKALLNSVKTLQTILNDLKGRKTRFQPEEILDQPSDDDISLKEIKRIFSYDDFVKYVSKYLDEDALKYLHANMNSGSESVDLLRNMAKATLESSQSLGDTKLNKTDIAFGLDKLLEDVSKVDEAVELMVRCSKTRLDRYGNFHEVLKKQDLTLEKFGQLKSESVDTLNNSVEGKHDLKKLRAIRDSIPNPTNKTILRKTIPPQDIEKYIGEGGRNTIRGYIARDGDVSHINGYQNVWDSLSLDYVNENGEMPFPPGGNSYGYIKFYTEYTDSLEIPYGEGVFTGGKNKDGYPCTRNGFLGSKNDEIIPEWWVKDGGEITPKDGAELHKVIDGNDTIVAIFKEGHFLEPWM